MRLTFEELRMLPMTYVFGLNRDDLCARKYINEEWQIAKEVVTPRKVPGDIYSGFKKPKVSFYRGNTGKVYNSARALWEGEFLTPWFTEVRPVRDGWYETDRGTLFFETHTGQWFRDPVAAIPVVGQLKWRGLLDIELK
jgi:hypothetical protein